ncbi:sensor histidine kinase [Rathayibacter sp. SD072]|uniref:sensor histidine kinase n=1 Tax=Rathayibacter sp. SD072 TaxID=2781731 RepID=UPI001A977359|nr:histidine kinase [Rathayibacter sp. SD072]MBO0983590.1 sensor histidine kinase [Rathayibacter sp. SD072]
MSTAPETIDAPPSGRGVSATWWYTVLSAASFVLVVLFVWGLPVVVGATELWRVVLYLGGTVLWCAAFLVTALRYRGVPKEAPFRLRAQATGVFAAGLAGSAAGGIATGSVTFALSLAFVLVGVLPWPRGVRGRLTGLATLVLVVAAVLEHDHLGTGLLADSPSDIRPLLLFFAIALPASVVSMLWWWDIVRELDRARAAEGRLAAAQERLILAGDVHDLQGHHLQVIALQLELAERLLRDDPDAALEQLRAAQRSVDGARTGTRELATRFRSVSLSDELENAADLLRSAGLRVQLDIGAGADLAPADALGPVVRESTTNILKHGGGESARLRLAREGGEWRFLAENDLPPEPEDPDEHGSGIAGMTERIERAGGTLRTRPTRRAFAVEARLPIGGAE